MIHKIVPTLILAFLSLNSILFAESENNQSELEMELSKFQMRQGGNEKTSPWELEGKTARSKGTTIDIHEVSLNIYPENSPKINITSPFCSYLKTDKVIQSSKNVRVESENFILKGKDYFFEIDKQKMHINNNAVMIIKKTDFIKSSNTKQE